MLASIKVGFPGKTLDGRCRPQKSQNSLTVIARDAKNVASINMGRGVVVSCHNESFFLPRHGEVRVVD